MDEMLNSGDAITSNSTTAINAAAQGAQPAPIEEMALDVAPAASPAAIVNDMAIVDEIAIVV